MKKCLLKVMNIDQYKNKIFDNKTIISLLKSEDDIEKGRTRNAIEIIKKLREEYGF